MPRFLVVSTLLFLPALALARFSLVDNPIAGASVSYLDGTGWFATSSTAQLAINARVPGDLLTDLERNGVIGDPLREMNFKNSSLWNDHVWTYITPFETDQEELLLVFDGIKMSAEIAVNGVSFGIVKDQFLRVVLQLNSTVLKANNTLSVTFDPSVTCNGRFMACTGGWDWAPYSDTSQPGTGGDANTFSKGIWKSVYLVQVDKVAITHLVPHVFYNGSFPTKALEEGNHAGFVVRVQTHLWAAAAGSGTLSVSSEWGVASSTDVTLVAGDNVVTVELFAPADKTKLWWPVGYGAQPLYKVSAEFVPTGNQSPSAKADRAIGLRLFALVTGNDTAPGYVQENAHADGSDTHGMVFRVNGAAVFSRGANMIPMEELEGRYNAAAHVQLVQSAVDGGMNTLRVWGGGVFLPDAWYDACDELGVLVFHDMMYAQNGHAPSKTVVEDAEFRHQVRRLSHHPSIVIWDGCNECRVVLNTPTGIYATFVMTVVAEEDQSRAIMPSCPSEGWDTGVNRLTGHPNGSPKGLQPSTKTSAHTFETHGPYQHGTGFPAVNGDSTLQLFDANIPIKISPTQTGLQLENVFASEFGCVTMSSFESMSPTLDESHWALHAGQPSDDCSGGFQSECKGPNVMAQRNYPCDNLIDVYFGPMDYNKTGETEFKKSLYYCMLAQALEMKSNIETRRATNQFGIVIWQLNEIWPTGGWGSLEYGTPVEGQVVGGRWKPLHYLLKNTVFADVMATCGDGGECYIKNDGPKEVNGEWIVSSVSLADGNVTALRKENISLAAGPGVTHFVDGLPAIDAKTHILFSQVVGEGVYSANVIPLLPPKNLTLTQSHVEFHIDADVNADGSVNIHLTTDVPALYVTFTTLAQGRFSDNAFLLLKEATIQFLPFGALDMPLLKNSLRVEDLASYMLQ